MFEPLPALMRLRRQQLRLSLDAASALADVSRSRLAAFETGNENISLDLLVKLANAYGMTELRIGGLRVEGAAPDFQTLVVAAEVFAAAEKIVEQATALAEELKRLSGPMAELLAPVLPAPARSRQAESEPHLETLARMLAKRRREDRRPHVKTS